MTEHKRHHPLQIRFSIIILGDGGVGKTNLISRITENVFVEDLIPTIGIDFRLKLVPTNKDGTGLSIKTMVCVACCIVFHFLKSGVGHGWSRAFSKHHQVLLPWCQWDFAGVRRDRQGIV